MSLGGTTPSADSRRCVEVKLVGRIRKDYRANVATFNDQIVLSSVITHSLDKNLSNFRDRAHAWNFAVYAIFVQMFRQIDIVDQKMKFSVLQDPIQRQSGD